MSSTLDIGGSSSRFRCQRPEWPNLTDVLTILLLLPSLWPIFFHLCCRFLWSGEISVRYGEDLNKFIWIFSTFGGDLIRSPRSPPKLMRLGIISLFVCCIGHPTLFEMTLTNLTRGFTQKWQLISKNWSLAMGLEFQNSKLSGWVAGLFQTWFDSTCGHPYL